jgi:hypothetical protein
MFQGTSIRCLSLSSIERRYHEDKQAIASCKFKLQTFVHRRYWDIQGVFLKMVCETLLAYGFSR